MWVPATARLGAALFIFIRQVTGSEPLIANFDQQGYPGALSLVQLRASARSSALAEAVVEVGATYEEPSELRSGQVAFFRSIAAGRYLSYDDHAGVRAPFADRRGRSGFLLVKKKDGRIKDNLPINAGDTVYLKTYRGDFIDVEDAALRTRWKTADDWQSFVISKNGTGPIRRHDTIYLQTHLGKFIQVAAGNVTAQGSEAAKAHAFTIDAEPRGDKVEDQPGTSKIVRSGDVAYLWTPRGTQVGITETGRVHANRSDFGGMPGVLLLKEEFGDLLRGSPLRSGDVVYLRTYKGYYLAAENNTISTRWREVGPWQAFFIRKSGGGLIHTHDAVSFEAHNGEHLLAKADGVLLASGKTPAAEHEFVLKVREAPTLEAHDRKLRSGDAIFLRARSGKYAGVDNAHGAHVRYSNTLGRPGFFLLKVEYGEVQDGFGIRSGDVVCLKSYRGEFLDVEGHLVQARWSDPGDYQVFVAKKAEEGPLMDGDAVSFLAHTGEHLTEFNESLWSEGLKANASHFFSLYRPRFGALHDVVGRDGVIMISMEKEGQPRRHEHSLLALTNASVFPVSFPATDSASAIPTQLQLTCPLAEQPGSSEWCEEMGRVGEPGCSSVPEQAIADSHRRALLKAKKRGDRYGKLEENAPNWTAILEEDAVPVDAAAFDEQFRAAWAALPNGTKLVRLGWCDFADELGGVEDRAFSRHGQLRLVAERWFTTEEGKRQYHTGGCTTGYVVHRSLLDEMLQMFPCCCAFDCCLERHLLRAPARRPAEEGQVAEGDFTEFRGREVMVDMDHEQAGEFSRGFASFRQSGVLVQDHRPFSIFGEFPEA